MRIVDGCRIFNITGFVDPDGYRRKLVIYAKEFVDAPKSS